MAYGIVKLSGFFLTPPDTTAPTTPTGLTATAGNTSAVLSWTASTDNVAVTGYRVYVGGVLNQTVTDTAATITGLTNNTTYSLTVTAIDAAGNASAQSAAVSVTPVVVYAKDSFNRANGAAGSTEVGGYAWTANPTGDQASWGINSNRMSKLNTFVLTAPKELLIDDGQANGTIKVTFVSANTGVSGIAFRVTSDLSSGFLASRDSASGTYTIKHRSGTTYTTLYTSSGIGAAGDVVQVVLNGTSISLKVNGTTLTTITSSLSLTGTKHGLWGGATAASTYEDFEHNGAVAV